jgi:hypothetical protein
MSKIICRNLSKSTCRLQRDGRYRIKLKPGDVRKHKDALVRVIKKAKGLEDDVEQEVGD